MAVPFAIYCVDCQQKRHQPRFRGEGRMMPADEQPWAAADEAAEPVDPDPAIDERLVVDEMNACVRQVIDSLPDVYRAALVLHDLEGLSAEQTAEICDCSVATAKIRIHRARLRLREALKAQCEFYRDPESVFRCDRKA